MDYGKTCLLCQKTALSCVCPIVAAPGKKAARESDVLVIETPAEIAQIADDAMQAELAVLLEAVRKLPPPTEKHRQAQALGWAYSCVSMDNKLPKFITFFTLAQDRYQWTYGEFFKWAMDKTWG